MDKIINFKYVRKILSFISRYVYIGMLKKQNYDNKTLLLIFDTFKDVSSPNSLSLDLGSGPTPRNPFCASKSFGVDIRDNKDNNVIYCDFSKEKLPFNDNYFDYLTAFDVIEHIPRFSQVGDKTKFPFVEIMNEIFRVLKPGGIFFHITPAYPYKSAFQDPTHINIITEDTFDYYFGEKAWARIYGFKGHFSIEKEGWLDEKYFCFMKKLHKDEEYNLGFKQC